MSETAKTIFQPIHESIRNKLDAEYVKLHDDILQYCAPSESGPWSADIRSRPSLIGFASPKLVEVGSVMDIDVDEYQVRVFTPESETPNGGWPCFVYYHGGGWVIGGLNSENGFLRHLCKYLNCVVLSINYRHAPEHCYPIAINDSFAGLKWVLTPDTATRLSINTTKLAIGGLSAGGGLASSVSMKAAVDPGITEKIVCQILICPVIDNTATVDTVWATSKHSPWLTPSRMTWYRNMYFRSDDETRNWDASPCFAPMEVLQKSPSTFLAVAECDLLAPEAIRYGDFLRRSGADVDVQLYSGATHSILILAGLHKVGQKLVHDVCACLAKSFDVIYDRETVPILPQPADAGHALST